MVSWASTILQCWTIGQGLLNNVKVSSMATTILSLITDHINFLEQSKQAQAADQVKLFKLVYNYLNRFELQ